MSLLLLPADRRGRDLPPTRKRGRWTTRAPKATVESASFVPVSWRLCKVTYISTPALGFLGERYPENSYVFKLFLSSSFVVHAKLGVSCLDPGSGQPHLSFL